MRELIHGGHRMRTVLSRWLWLEFLAKLLRRRPSTSDFYVARTGGRFECINSRCGLWHQQEGNGPINLRRQGRWKLPPDLKSVTSITYLSMCILLIWYEHFWQPLRPLQPPNSLGGQIWPHIWNQRPQLPTYPCEYCLYGMGPLGSLRGHYSLQTALEVKFDLRFEISGLNHLCDPSFKVTLFVKKWLYREEKENHDPLTSQSLSCRT